VSLCPRIATHLSVFGGMIFGVVLCRERARVHRSRSALPVSFLRPRFAHRAVLVAAFSGVSGVAWESLLTPVGALCGVLALAAICCPLLFSYAYYRVFLRLIALSFLLFPIQQGGALQLTLTARCIFAYENPLALTGSGLWRKGSYGIRPHLWWVSSRAHHLALAAGFEGNPGTS